MTRATIAAVALGVMLCARATDAQQPVVEQDAVAGADVAHHLRLGDGQIGPLRTVRQGKADELVRHEGTRTGEPFKASGAGSLPPVR